MNPGIIYLLGTGVLFFTRDKLREFIAIALSILTIIVIYNLTADQSLIVSFLDFNLVLLKVDNISKIIGLSFAFFGLCSMIYASNLSDGKYYILSQLYIGSSIAILFVGDFFSFYICWELMTISSYFLIFNNEKPITKQTSYYYFIMQMVGAISLLWGILLQYTGTGNLELTNIKYGLPFFLLAIGIKLAFISLHTWLPQNYSNVPFHISVLLSAYTTKVGVYALYKLLSGLNFLGYAGIITALSGVFLALRQTKVRKLLSYHIISQIGYMITAISVGTTLGAGGGIIHLINNILYKGLLFMVIGIIIYRTGKEDLIELGGLAKKLPLLTFYAIVAALSIAGFPFFSGHISKLIIKKALHNQILSWGLYLAGIGTSLSFLKVIYFAFFRELDEEVEINDKSDKAMLFGMGLITTVLLVIGLNPKLLTDFLALDNKVHFFSLKYIWKGIEPIILATIIFKVAHDIIKPHHHKVRAIDIYPLLAKGIEYPSKALSYVHNGDLGRYLLWVVSTLLLLWITLLF
jgi:multicomponent Na+:H+ antiporter subunit D